MRKDLVCDMHVDEHSAAAVSHYGGVTYYFCSPSCKEQFDEQPKRYIRKRDTPPTHRKHQAPDT